MLLESINERTLMAIGSVLYAAAFAFAFLVFAKNKDKLRPIFLSMLVIGFLFQSFGLYIRGDKIHNFPLTNAYEILQVLSWCAIVLNLILRQLFHLRLLNFFASGLGALLGLTALIFTSLDYLAAPSALDGNPWVGFHAALAIFSYSVFGVLAITSLMYLIQNYGLQNMRSGGLFARLPAIRQLEEINSKLILLGVSVLTIAIGIGSLNWLTEPGTVGLLKLAVAIAVWLFCIAILFLRQKNRLIAAPFAQACVFLFLAALLSLWPLTRRSQNEARSNQKNQTLETSKQEFLEHAGD